MSRLHAIFRVVLVAACATVSVHAGTIVFKLGALATGANAISGDEYTFWAGSGGFHEGNGTAASVLNNTLDYKNSWVDSAINWSSVISVNAGMYAGGVEVAWINFLPSSDKLSFYAATNVTGSTYSDLGSFTGNFFSEAGDGSYNRRWFINQNYGGCGSDSGWFVVEDGTSSRPCTWETSRENGVGRDFLYTTGGTIQNWNTANVGSADVFAISVTTKGSAAPEPGTLALLTAGLSGLALGIRRKRRKAL